MKKVMRRLVLWAVNDNKAQKELPRVAEVDRAELHRVEQKVEALAQHLGVWLQRNPERWVAQKMQTPNAGLVGCNTTTCERLG